MNSQCSVAQDLAYDHSRLRQGKRSPQHDAACSLVGEKHLKSLVRYITSLRVTPTSGLLGHSDSSEGHMSSDVHL
jgi:hypothetical protein